LRASSNNETPLVVDTLGGRMYVRDALGTLMLGLLAGHLTGRRPPTVNGNPNVPSHGN
jgi:hypothetical protein